VKRLGTMVVVGALLLSWSLAPSADVVFKVGYVDFQKVVESWPEAKRKIEQLETQYEEIQAEMDRMDEEITQKRKDLEVRKDILKSKEQEQAMEEEIRGMLKNYMETFDKKRKGLEQQKTQTLEEVRLRVKAVVQDVAERNGYSLVLRKRDLVYAVEQYDITDAVIAELKK